MPWSDNTCRKKTKYHFTKERLKGVITKGNFENAEIFITKKTL